MENIRVQLQKTSQILFEDDYIKMFDRKNLIKQAKKNDMDSLLALGIYFLLKNKNHFALKFLKRSAKLGNKNAEHYVRILEGKNMREWRDTVLAIELEGDLMDSY